MPDGRARWRGWRWLAFGTALVLALGAAAFLALSVQDHNDARDDLADARGELVIARANSSRDAQTLTNAQQTVGSVRDQLSAIDQSAVPLAEFDEQDLEAVRAAIQAGLAGDVTAYNAAVDQRAALDPQHDATVDQLRQQANAVIAALAAFN